MEVVVAGTENSMKVEVTVRIDGREMTNLEDHIFGRMHPMHPGRFEIGLEDCRLA